MHPTASRRTTRAPLRITVDLVGKAQAGDRQAQSRLFARYESRVLRLVRRNMNRLRPLHDSLDVSQEVFLHAWKAFPRFEMRNDSAFLNWLAKIVQTTANGLRDKADAIKRPSYENLEFDPVAADSDVADEAAEREERRTARKAVERLRPPQRRVVELRYYEQLPWREVAQRTGRASPDAARQAERAARMALRAKLAQRLET
jgi:RNA polymerase sigma-70 factor (ECF subfamily)